MPFWLLVLGELRGKAGFKDLLGHYNPRLSNFLLYHIIR